MALEGERLLLCHRINERTSAAMLRRYGASAAAERAKRHYDQVMTGK